jgi:hypothetical protein
MDGGTAIRRSRFRVPGSWFPGSKFEVRGSRFEVRGSRFEVRGSKVRGSALASNPERGTPNGDAGSWNRNRNRNPEP